MQRRLIFKKKQCHERGELRTEKGISSALILYMPSGFHKTQPYVTFRFLLSQLCAPPFSVSPHKAAGLVPIRVDAFLCAFSLFANAEPRTMFKMGVHLNFIQQQKCPLSCCYNISWLSATVFCLLFGCDSEFRYGSILPTILDK